MNTENFLAHILPGVGLRAVVTITKRGARQSFFSDNASAASFITKRDTAGTNVYMACATFKDDTSRKAVNVEAVKAFWLDIDCGEGKSYVTQQEAMEALGAFCSASLLPDPTIISSGVGLHIYWTLDEAVTQMAWLPVAQRLKRVAAERGLQAGPERTADVASILRPAGTQHRKNADLPVRVLSVGSSHSLAHIQQCLGADDGTADFDTVSSAPAPQFTHVDNSDLGTPSLREAPAPSAEVIAGYCEVIRTFKDTGGTAMTEPLWRACLAVVRVCEDGEQLCHEWSAKDRRYTERETQSKIDGLDGTGPTLCSTFESHAPAVCQACPLYQTCKSPVSNAHKVAVVPVVAPPVQGGVILPAPFMWMSTGGVPGIHVPIFDKLVGQHFLKPICQVLFYPVAKIEDAVGKVSMQWRAHISDTHVVEFVIPNSLASEPSKLAGALAERQITMEPGMSAQLTKYFNSWINYQRSQPSTKSHNAFGWTDDLDFVYGERKYCADGSIVPVVLSGTAQTRAKKLEPRGDLATWSSLVDRAYNNDQSYPWQFALLTSMGAPLLDLLNTVQGVTVYMHSEESGFGKSTAEQVALSVWGTSEGLALANERVTTNALAANLGAMRNLPAVLDELTAMDNKAACALVHLVSSGQPKERCGQTGELLVRQQTWRTFLLASGNVLLGEKMALHRAHAEAEVARLWEYTIPNIKPSQRVLQPDDAFQIFRQFSDHYGVAGDALISYIVTNRTAVAELVGENLQKVLKGFKLGQKERFWASLIACVLTAHSIARDLELIAFPAAPLVKWIHETLLINRASMSEAITNYNDAFSQMLGEYHGQMLVTEGKGSLYLGKEAFIYRHPTQGKPIVGRVIIKSSGPLGSTDPEGIYLTVAAAREWCSRNNVSYREVVKHATASGLVRGATARFQLGTGCPSYMPITQTVECLVLDLAPFQSMVGQIPSNLTVVAGGKSGP